MSKNIVETIIENKLIEDIKNLKMLVAEIRTRQDVGADAVQIVISGLVTSATFTLTAGNNAVIINTVTPDNQILSLWNLFRTIEANNNPVGTFKHWPDENDDSGHLLGKVIRWEGDMDWAQSNDATGVRKAFFIVENNDNHTLDVRYRSKWYGIKQGVTVS